MAEPTQSEKQPASIQERLQLSQDGWLDKPDWEDGDFAAAIRGEKVPYGLGSKLIKLCLIRGIRYHYGFAEELRGEMDEFTRALNARSIMSNVIQEIDPEKPEEIPYCIWFPDIPTEDTCRELLKRYPQMVYQIARACAVAGYNDLYAELDALPEVHVAEEARECGNMAIYNAIMASPVKYAVMDDYAREISLDSPKPAFLNGDTAVRAILEKKQRFSIPEADSIFFEDGFSDHRSPFNITEDLSIDEYDSERDFPEDPPTQVEDVTPLLYTPLPMDLPTINKDLLIEMAAYFGDVDRYARLHRPTLGTNEQPCVIRGIYYNTLFAKWFSLQEFQKTNNWIQRAITARFIMNNDLSRISNTSDRSMEIPYNIFRPDVAQPSTYEELARRKPSMLPQIIRACIVADYQTLFDKLYTKIPPEYYALHEAESSYNPYYLEVLQKRAAEFGMDRAALDKTRTGCDADRDHTPKRNLRVRIGSVSRASVMKFGVGSQFCCLEDGELVQWDELETYLSIPDEWKLDHWKENPKHWVNENPIAETNWIELDYVNWPPAEVDPERTTLKDEGIHPNL